MTHRVPCNQVTARAGVTAPGGGQPTARSPALAPTSDTIAAIQRRSSESPSDMDCSTDSEDGSDVGIAAASTFRPRPISAATFGHGAPVQSVPGLDLGSIVAAPPAERAYQSEKPECIKSSSITPPWRAPRLRHTSDPGDGALRRSTYQSLPTFRDFLGTAPLSDSGVSKSTISQAEPPSAPAPPEAERTSGQQCVQKSESEFKAPVRQFTKAPASTSTTQLTFRDLLPPPASCVDPLAFACTPPTSATPVSAMPRSVSQRPPSRYPSGTDASTDCGSAPRSTQAMSTQRTSGGATALPGSGVLFLDGSRDAGINADPGSPCMSCASPTAPPGSVLRSDGGVFEAPDNAQARWSLSPPSMTPPNQPCAPAHAGVRRRRSPPKLRVPVPGIGAVSMAEGSGRNMDGNQPVRSHAVCEVQQSGVQEGNKENAHGQQTQPAKLCVGPSKASTSAALAHMAQPLQCVTAAYTGQATQPWRTQRESQGTRQLAVVQQAVQEALEPGAWRARHFRRTTLNTYITDDLICEAIEASKRCAPAELPHNSCRRQSFHARPLTPDDLQQLECCARPASAPPTSEGALAAIASDDMSLQQSLAEGARQAVPAAEAAQQLSQLQTILEEHDRCETFMRTVMRCQWHWPSASTTWGLPDQKQCCLLDYDNILMWFANRYDPTAMRKGADPCAAALNRSRHTVAAWI